MIIKHCCLNECSVVDTLRAFVRHYGTQSILSRLVIINVVKLFEEHGSTNELPRSVRSITVIRKENIGKTFENTLADGSISIRYKDIELCMKR
uniref:DUF4817 domain-containing protein n=1 Tax=Strongyloides venezuelensis TaxID=75913 RepID=A0A0K0EWT8_STRVS